MVKAKSGAAMRPHLYRSQHHNRNVTGLLTDTLPAASIAFRTNVLSREPWPHASVAICGPTMVTSGIGCSAHGGGSTPAASAAMRAQWRSKPAGVQTST
jgi:hypothetical protein